jgi:methyltransferase
MVTTGLVAAGACIVMQRFAELRVAAANRGWAMAAGAKEYGRGHYICFILLHAGWLAGWLVEGFLRNKYSSIWALWLALFCLAQILRYWCISSLGRCWNTRILVIPDMQPVRRGPYRFLQHPNYLAVALELACVPLIFNAWITAIVAGLMNALLLLFIRIPAEEAALRRTQI